MTDLSVDERESMERACDEFRMGWVAAREYSKQREEKLRESLDVADWLICCLKDLAQAKVVRGLPEAEGAYYQLEGRGSAEGTRSELPFVCPVCGGEHVRWTMVAICLKRREREELDAKSDGGADDR